MPKVYVEKAYTTLPKKQTFNIPKINPVETRIEKGLINEIIIHKSIKNTSGTLYTVPRGKTFFLTYFSIGSLQVSSLVQELSAYYGTSSVIIASIYGVNEAQSISCNTFMRFDQNSKISVTLSGSGYSVIYGFEVLNGSEISA